MRFQMSVAILANLYLFCLWLGLFIPAELSLWHVAAQQQQHNWIRWQRFRAARFHCEQRASAEESDPSIYHLKFQEIKFNFSLSLFSQKRQNSQNIWVSFMAKYFISFGFPPQVDIKFLVLLFFFFQASRFY